MFSSIEQSEGSHVPLSWYPISRLTRATMSVAAYAQQIYFQLESAV